MQFFVSYAHADEDVVKLLARHLRVRGVAVRIDAELLRAGDSVVERLSAAIVHADFFLPVISKAWHASPWCKHELGIALTKQLDRNDRLRVLPCRLGSAELPPSLLNIYCRSIDRSDLEIAARRIVDDATAHLAGNAPVAIPTAVARRFLEATLRLDGAAPSPVRIAAGSGSSPSQMEFMKARDELRKALRLHPS